MKTTDIRQLSIEELRQKIRTSREALLESRLRKQSGQLERTHEIKEVRREIARVQTILNEKLRSEAKSPTA